MHFIDRIGHLAKRFEDVVVCMDCNEVEGKIKVRIKADKYFTFHPWEIRRAYIPKPKQRHEFIEEHMDFYRRLYAAHKVRLVDTRKRVLIDLIDAAGTKRAVLGSERRRVADVLAGRPPRYFSNRLVRESGSQKA